MQGNVWICFIGEQGEGRLHFICQRIKQVLPLQMMYLGFSFVGLSLLTH